MGDVEAIDRKRARAIDRWAQEALGIPGEVLMENAGRRVAEETERLARERQARRVVVVAGPGNNGGDGFVAARHLLDGPVAVETLLLGSLERLRGDAAANARRLAALGEQLVETAEARTAIERLAAEPAPVVVDALFGTGLDRPVEGMRLEVLRFLEASALPVVAVDLPSGLDADTGEVLGACPRASVTVTFVAPKVGFERAEGPGRVGRVVVAPIGFPPGRGLAAVP